MIGALRSQWLLFRLAAGIRRPETPRELTLNMARAVNFAVITFAFGVLIYATLFFFIFSLAIVLTILGTSVNTPEAFIFTIVIAIAPFIVALFAIFFVPRILTFPAKNTFGVFKVKTEIKGYALALATSSAIACIFWLGPLTYTDYDTGFIVRISILSWPVVILINSLLLVICGITLWEIRRGYGSNNARVLLWVVNGIFFAVTFLVGWLAWWFILLL